MLREFVEIGDALDAADPHGRMIGIHPMTQHGSVREFQAASWMSFADYQQNYRDLHRRILESRNGRAPVVNSEYGYFLRDQDGDGRPDMSNSYSIEDMRFASWDIAMAGGYLVTGFGTTYFGGRRDPGPFDLDAAKNRVWEDQIGFIKRLFASLDWPRLVPADDLVTAAVQRGQDVQADRDLHPPAVTYWAMADPGNTYVVYARGLAQPLTLEIKPGKYRLRQYNPRTGEFGKAAPIDAGKRHELRPPSAEDWVWLIQAAGQRNGGL